jgi:hypothetical protein
MKKKIILQISAGLVTILIACNSFAQNTDSKKEKDKLYLWVDVIKNSPDLISNDASTAASVSVNEKVSRSFSNYFGNAAEQNWSMVGRDFLNRFHANGVLTNALFDKRGSLIYTITYGAEKDLPNGIRKIVKREYFDYLITMAIHVKENSRTIWVVQMEDEKTHLTVRIENGEMEEVRQFNKS